MQKQHDPADAFQRALDAGADEPELERLVGLTTAIAKLRAETVAPERLRKRILRVVRNASESAR